MKLRISGIIEESIVDGPGIRFVVFTQGCPHKCLGCHNPETHDFLGGKEIDTNQIVENFKKYSYMTGITFSGGEPFSQIDAILSLILQFKNTFPSKNIVIYTGYTFEELLTKNNQTINQILSLSDYLIDGKFEINKRDISLIFRGSSNQRIIDLKKSLNENKIILKEF